MEPDHQIQDSPPPLIHVALEEPGAPATLLKFAESFTVGSDPECDLAIESPSVSPEHAAVVFEQNQWWIQDLESKTGTLIDGKKIDRVALASGTKVLLGPDGPSLTFTIQDVNAEGVAGPRRRLRLPQRIRRAFQKTRLISLQEHKELLRRALEKVKRQDSRKYLKIIGAIGFLGLLAGSYAYYKHDQYEKLAARAEEVFYQIKELELGFSRLETKLLATADSSTIAEVRYYRSKLKELNASYDRYVDELGIYEGKLDEKTRTIYRVARVFGECEITMPKGFVEEVENYIHEWKLSQRLPNAIERARVRGYQESITRAMVEQNLPPQFFYLALQESDFDSSLCGPATRFGIAKGMWQFIPSTAVQYGLRTGPLVQVPKRDPRDERHRVTKSTDAAARYLRDIYSTEAQASGLLVIASYNWGHNVVKGLIRELPENPRERNFWKFLTTYRSRIPKQTYDYVFYIFSAAVIGENPKLFGFNFDKPLNAEAM